jgi:hypothetical protein
MYFETTDEQRELCLSVRRFVHERRTGEGTTETQRVVV